MKMMKKMMKTRILLFMILMKEKKVEVMRAKIQRMKKLNQE
jgi:hypothetical protein